MEEKEGINIDFYFILWEKYKELYHSSFGVGLPHTVVYRNQYPIAWFFTNKEDQILKKRNSNLNGDAIFHHFTTKKQTKSDVLGYFIESDPDDYSTKITYFDEPRLREFLDNVNLRPERGVLQQFIDPVGEHNAMYRANWCERTCMISKKVNRKNLFTKSLNIYERCCTFEGHHIFSDECTVAGGLLPGVIRKCMDRMHLHIFALSQGNSLFKRADGFFKQDATGKIWFLWNNCYRIQLKVILFLLWIQKDNTLLQIYQELLWLEELCVKHIFFKQAEYEAIKFRIRNQGKFIYHVNADDIFNRLIINQIPDWVEKGATYDQRRPNQLQKDLLCQNCNELHKHQNFAPIAYKYLIFSREKKAHIPIEKRGKSSLDSSLVEESKGVQTGEGTVTTTTAKLNSQILNDTKEIDDLIDQINNQRVIVDTNYKITIPEIFQKIHPKMTDYTYQNIKDNPKFYSKQFWVCQNCYLNLISYNQLESGCAPQINYKQILSSYYDFKPKPLRTEFIKFQQECFDLFLDENKYQQQVWQNCTKSGNVEDYYKNKKRKFYEKLQEQQNAQNKRIEIQKLAKKKEEQNKVLSEEEKQKCHLNMLRDKQRRITSHIDFVINQAQQSQQNSFSYRPSTSMTTMSKNIHINNTNDNFTQIKPQSSKNRSFKAIRRSESNIAQVNNNNQYSLEESSLKYTNSFAAFSRVPKIQLNPEDPNEYNSLHSTLHESQGSLNPKNYLLNVKDYENVNNKIQENEQFEMDELGMKQDSIKQDSQNLDQQDENINNEVQIQHLQSPVSNNGQVVLFQPVRKTPVKSPAFGRKVSNPNLKVKNQQYVRNLRSRDSNTPSHMTAFNESDTQRPASSDRFHSKSTLQETGLQFRSKTPSLSYGSRTLYSVTQNQSQISNKSQKNQQDLQQIQSYLTSTFNSKELKPSTAQNKYSKTRSFSTVKLKKKSPTELYLDNVGQQASFNKQYFGKHNRDLSNNEFQGIINHYASAGNSVHQSEQANNEQQLDNLQEKYKIDLNEEIEEYGNNQNLENNEKQKQDFMNNFKKIQFYPKQDHSVKQYLKANSKNTSSQENIRSTQIQNVKNSFHTNLNNYLSNINTSKQVLNNSNKSQKQHLIQDLYKKYSINSRSDLMSKQVKQQSNK